MPLYSLTCHTTLALHKSADLSPIKASGEAPCLLHVVRGNAAAVAGARSGFGEGGGAKRRRGGQKRDTAASFQLKSKTSVFPCSLLSAPFDTAHLGSLGLQDFRFINLFVTRLRLNDAVQ